MKLIKPKVSIIQQDSGLDGIFKQIEVAGRTCYKSEDRITPSSSSDFVKKIISLGHTAMLEHGTVYLTAPTTSWDWDLWALVNNKYTEAKFNEHTNYITTNYRVIVENNWFNALSYISDPTPFHEKRVTARFICDRGVSHELVRHRTFSFAQESTRYCNYSKDKFGRQITFIIPSWTKGISEGEYQGLINPDELNDADRLFMGNCLLCEDDYFSLLDNACTPQQARQVLPNSLKTEVVMTGFVKDWKHFFDLRCAKSAHPDMQVLANSLKDQFEEAGLI